MNQHEKYDSINKYTSTYGINLAWTRAQLDANTPKDILLRYFLNYKHADVIAAANAAGVNLNTYWSIYSTLETVTTYLADISVGRLVYNLAATYRLSNSIASMEGIIVRDAGNEEDAKGTPVTFHNTADGETPSWVDFSYTITRDYDVADNNKVTITPINLKNRLIAASGYDEYINMGDSNTFYLSRVHFITN